MDMSQQLEKDAAEHGMNQGGDWLTIKDGDTRIRVLSFPKIIVSRFGFGKCYTGAPYCQPAALEADWIKLKEKATAEGKDPEKVKKPSLTYRYLAWVINRADGKLYLYEMPLTIYKSVAKLQKNEEYAFETFPMPYDITISADKAGTTAVDYQVSAARKNTDLTPEELAAFENQKQVEDLVERMKEKAKEDYEKGGKSMSVEPGNMNDVLAAADENAPNPDDIPF